jgi:hypothetical protein
VRLPPFFAGANEAHLRQHLAALLAIRDCVVDAALRAMEEVAQQAQGVAVLVETILAKGWNTTFQKAALLSGRGVFNARQNMMELHAVSKTSGLVKKAMKSMDEQYRENVIKFQKTLADIWKDGLMQVEQQVAAVLQRMGADGDAASGNGNQLPPDSRARRIHGLIFQWEGDWKAPEACSQMDVDVGGGGGDEASTALPTESLPEPGHPSLEDLLPDMVAHIDEDGGNDDDAALNADLMMVGTGKPKRASKRKADGDGGKAKAQVKKRKTAAAPKKAAGKAAESKAGGAKGARGGKGGARGGAKGGGRGRGRGKS